MMVLISGTESLISFVILSKISRDSSIEVDGVVSMVNTISPSSSVGMKALPI